MKSNGMIYITLFFHMIIAYGLELDSVVIVHVHYNNKGMWFFFFFSVSFLFSDCHFPAS